MTERDAMGLQSDKAMSVKGIYLTICKLVRLLISNIMSKFKIFEFKYNDNNK